MDALKSFSLCLNFYQLSGLRNIGPMVKGQIHITIRELSVAIDGDGLKKEDDLGQQREQVVWRAAEQLGRWASR